MSLSIGATSSTVAITGTVVTGGLPTGAAWTIKSGLANGAQTTTVHTVTAGKTLYIQSCSVGAWNAGAGTSDILLEADVNGTGTYLPLIRFTINSIAAGVWNQCPTLSFQVPITVPATKLVRITCSSATGEAYGNIVGWEV